MVAVLVTGNPGSGKTSLAQELRRRGVAAMDADVLAEWESIDGTTVVVPSCLGEEWLRRHRWVWPRARLEEVIHEHGDPLVILCGIATNQRVLLDLFDKVLLLAIDDDTQFARLDSSGDRNAAERAQVMTGRPFFEAEMRAGGAQVLDGRQSTAWVADQVLLQVAG